MRRRSGSEREVPSFRDTPGSPAILNPARGVRAEANCFKSKCLVPREPLGSVPEPTWPGSFKFPVATTMLRNVRSRGWSPGAPVSDSPRCRRVPIPESRSRLGGHGTVTIHCQFHSESMRAAALAAGPHREAPTQGADTPVPVPDLPRGAPVPSVQPPCKHLQRPLSHRDLPSVS